MITLIYRLIRSMNQQNIYINRLDESMEYVYQQTAHINDITDICDDSRIYNRLFIYSKYVTITN